MGFQPQPLEVTGFGNSPLEVIFASSNLPHLPGNLKVLESNLVVPDQGPRHCRSSSAHWVPRIVIDGVMGSVPPYEGTLDRHPNYTNCF